MTSIMHKKDGTCYLCMMLHADYSIKANLEEHHAIYGMLGAGRKLSERWGLKVYLCPQHHQNSMEAVHHNAKAGDKFGMLIKQQAQRDFERKYPTEDFRAIFGKNYIENSAKAKRDTGIEITFFENYEDIRI